MGLEQPKERACLDGRGLGRLRGRYSPWSAHPSRRPQSSGGQARIISATDNRLALVQAHAPPRLIHLADYGGAFSGSFVQMLLAIGRAAQKRGWSIELVFSELSRERHWLAEVERTGIPYRFVDLGRGRARRWSSWVAFETSGRHWRPPTTRALEAVLSETAAPTVLHTHFSAFDVAAAHAARSSGHASVVWHHHSMRRPGWRATVGGLVTYRVFARNVSRFVCVAPDVTTAVRRLAGRDRVEFVPNAIDPQFFSPATASARRQARARLGIPTDASVLLHFGSHWLRKGGDLYLTAVNELLNTNAGDHLRAVTIGGGEARAAVDAANLQSIVAVLEPTEAVRDLYAAADVLVSPSRAEGMPLALLEALAVGLPVVASNIPGQAFVGKSVEACRLTSLSPEDISSSIYKVLGLRPEQRRREQAAGREWVIENMSLESWAERLMQMYQDIFRTHASA
jgi:glycosyltransferase involved in cell wall biosynthesis